MTIKLSWIHETANRQILASRHVEAKSYQHASELARAKAVEVGKPVTARHGHKIICQKSPDSPY